MITTLQTLITLMAGPTSEAPGLSKVGEKRDEGARSLIKIASTQ